MKRMFNEEGEEIVYIEYCDGIPHKVITAPVDKEWGLTTFDFEFIGSDKKDICWYNSGMGGNKKELQAPHFCSPKGKRYWMADGAKFKGRTKAINCKRVDKPLVIKFFGRHQSMNPFKFSWETSSGFEWCDICKEHNTSDEACREHQEWSDEKGCFIYLHDGSLVQ
jgi:hypothetical protein